MKKTLVVFTVAAGLLFTSAYLCAGGSPWSWTLLAALLGLVAVVGAVWLLAVASDEAIRRQVAEEQASRKAAKEKKEVRR